MISISNNKNTSENVEYKLKDGELIYIKYSGETGEKVVSHSKVSATSQQKISTSKENVDEK